MARFFAEVEFLLGAWELLCLSETFMGVSFSHYFFGVYNVIADGILFLLA